jgi:pimeloyl-ACP methyl ester carboxylesterase
MTSAFKGEPSKVLLTEWFERFRARIPLPTQSRMVKTRIGDTHVLVGGPEDGPSVVLLHGAMATSAHALRELAPLLERFRVYAVDVVGQSVKSADTRPSVANNEYGEWLKDVLDGLGLQKTHVIGVSWGGFVSIRLAALAPERIARLALLVPAGVVPIPHWESLTKVGLPMLFYRLAPSEKRLKAFVSNLLTTTDDDWAPYLGDAVRHYNMDMRVPSLARPEELKGFTAPTLVLGADADFSFPGARVLERAPALFQTLAGIELIKGSHHCPPTTDAFRRWLSDRLGAFLLEG